VVGQDGVKHRHLVCFSSSQSEGCMSAADTDNPGD
jgi:hypothetical protein